VNPRIDDLRRRLERDPASIAFAQLAEEYRRAGSFEEAVEVARAGLAVHAGYVSARVTLGRALLALGRIDEAGLELAIAIRQAPDNLAATRGLAAVHQQRGDGEAALTHFESALSLAPRDPGLQDLVSSLADSARTRREAQARAERTIAALERWLAAVHGTRTERRP
jgi:tetratricopeptide (TPR) repeat protein